MAADATSPPAIHRVVDGRMWSFDMRHRCWRTPLLPRAVVYTTVAGVWRDGARAPYTEFSAACRGEVAWHMRSAADHEDLSALKEYAYAATHGGTLPRADGAALPDASVWRKEEHGDLANDVASHINALLEEAARVDGVLADADSDRRGLRARLAASQRVTHSLISLLGLGAFFAAVWAFWGTPVMALGF